MKNLYKIKNELYIISDTENVNENCWIITDGKLVQVSYLLSNEVARGYKVILTTNKLLIKDGIQAIDDEFLEWFVKNPSFESVEVKDIATIPALQLGSPNGHLMYKIIIPKEEPKQLFTDYPITELGDKEFVEAPIRECELISYDDDKYCYVKVKGIEKEIKRCYIYPQKGRCGEVDCISIDEIKELLKEEPKQVTAESIVQKTANSLGKSIPETFEIMENFSKELDKLKEKMYSEEEVVHLLKALQLYKLVHTERIDIEKWLEKFKNK